MRAKAQGAMTKRRNKRRQFSLSQRDKWRGSKKKHGLLETEDQTGEQKEVRKPDHLVKDGLEEMSNLHHQHLLLHLSELEGR